jgi:hypothetical protein
LHLSFIVPGLISRDPSVKPVALTMSHRWFGLTWALVAAGDGDCAPAVSEMPPTSRLTASVNFGFIGFSFQRLMRIAEINKVIKNIVYVEVLMAQLKVFNSYRSDTLSS